MKMLNITGVKKNIWTAWGIPETEHGQ